MERQIEVFIDLDGNARLVGRLWSRSIKGRERGRRSELSQARRGSIP